VGWVPRARVDTAVPDPKPARLGHDAAAPRVRRPSAACVYDSELVAFGEDGHPDFPLVCQRMLNRDSTIPLALIVFDVVAYRGRTLIGDPYRKRRAILERIDLGGRAHVPEVFGDGEALFDAVCEQELEGVVAKRLDEPYRPGERRWVKIKNRDYWRFQIERESADWISRARHFI
jgi:ATP-dependent DNA ligase